MIMPVRKKRRWSSRGLVEVEEREDWKKSRFSFNVEQLLRCYFVSAGQGKRKGMGESASSWLVARKTKNESCKKVLSRKRE